MRALVTGGGGFLGRHFTAALEDRGSYVRTLDTKVSPAQDVRSWFDWDRTLPVREHWDLVVHCAAVVGGRAVIDGSPLETAVNLELDAAMFRWAAKARPGRVLYISSSAAYPVLYQRAGAQGRLREDDVTVPHQVLQPDQVYGWTKVMGEVLSGKLREAGVPVTVVRPFSGYGTDQDADYPFPAFIARALRREDPFRLWCGDCFRDFVHVDDVVAAALAAVDAELDGPVNICSGVGTSFFRLAEMVCAVAGYSPEIVADPAAPAGVAVRIGDPTAMYRIHRPRVSLLDGITRAIEHGRESQ